MAPSTAIWTNFFGRKAWPRPARAKIPAKMTAMQAVSPR